MLSWFRQLDDSQSVADVVAVTRDYFAMWSPGEIAQLPDSCRPARFRDATDLEDLHRCAVEEFRKTRATGPEFELLQKLTGFIGRACVRVAQFGADGSIDAEAPPEADATIHPGKAAVARGR